MPLSKCSLLVFALVLTFVPVLLLVGASGTCSAEDEPMGIEWGSPSMYFWHPGETKVEAFYVMNRGLLEDSYWLSVECDDARWACSLDRDNVWNVSSMERRTFNASVTAPLAADAGDYTNITLRAGSMTVNVSESLSWRAFVIKERALRVGRLGEGSLDLSDGLEATLDMFVRNTGDYPSEVELSAWTVVETEVVRSGLTVLVEPATMALGPGELGWFTLHVRVEDPSQFRSMVEYRTYVRANDTADKSVWDARGVPWSVPYEYSVSFSPWQGETFPAVPGVEGTLFVEVDQATNHLGDYRWDLRLDNQRIGWVVRPNATSITLTGTAMGEFAIAVTPPVDAAPGETLELRVSLTCPQRPEDVLNATYTFEVGTIRLLTISVTPDEMDLDYDAVPTFSLVLSNHGNVWQGVSFGASLGNGTEVRFTECANHRVGIPPLNRTEFILTLALDMHLRPGANTVEFWAVGEGLGKVTYGVVVNVPERVGLSVTHGHNGGILLDPNPPDEVVNLTLENTGNVQLALAMEYLVTPANSGIDLRPVGVVWGEVLLLDPWERRSLEVVVKVPTVYGGTEHIEGGDLWFTASHWGGEQIMTVVVPFDMVGPDLTIASVDWGALRPGEDSVARVNVSNVGTSPATMTFLSMSGGLDPDGPVLVPVPPLGVDGSAEVEVHFVPRDGTNLYTFSVDPDDGLVEIGVAPNELSTEKETPPGGSEGPGGAAGTASTWLALVALVALAVVAVAVVLLARRRRR